MRTNPITDVASAGRRRAAVLVGGVMLFALATLTACQASPLPGDPPVKPPVAAAGTVTDGSLTMPDGTVRTFHTYVPARLPTSQPVPLLVALHGATGWGAQFESTSGFDGYAESNDFIVVYPDGTLMPSSPTPNGRVWNGGQCCGVAAENRQNVDDVGFIRALIALEEHDHSINTDRVSVVGYSNGGILAYRLACEMPDVLAAVAVQSATMEVDSCTPSRPIPFFHIHGTADDHIPINGGPGSASLVGDFDFNSPIASVAELAALDGCPAAKESVDQVNPDLTYEEHSPCAGHAEVEMVKVTGAGHPWMGSGASGAYPNYDSTLQTWTFLAEHFRSPTS